MSVSPSQHIDKNISSVWNFLTVRETPKPSDAILALGRDDFAIPEKTLQLFNEKYAPIIVLVGGRGRLSGKLDVPESIAFMRYLLDKGVPESNILYETVSTNTDENFKHGLDLLEAQVGVISSVLIVTHGPHSRRALGYAQKYRKGITFVSCPDDCPKPFIGSLNCLPAISEIVGEIDRIVRYSELGYIEKTLVPGFVMESAKELGRWVKNTSGDL